MKFTKLVHFILLFAMACGWVFAAETPSEKLDSALSAIATKTSGAFTFEGMRIDQVLMILHRLKDSAWDRSTAGATYLEKLGDELADDDQNVADNAKRKLLSLNLGNDFNVIKKELARRAKLLDTVEKVRELNEAAALVKDAKALAGIRAELKEAKEMLSKLDNDLAKDGVSGIERVTKEITEGRAPYLAGFGAYLLMPVYEKLALQMAEEQREAAKAFSPPSQKPRSSAPSGMATGRSRGVVGGGPSH